MPPPGSSAFPPRGSGSQVPLQPAKLADFRMAGALGSGATAKVYDAVQIALGEMKKAKHNKKILLLITDGFDTRSHINAEQTEEILKRSGMLVYAIGIDDDDDDADEGRD